MNEFRLLPDDPKLTAYALGELTGDERAAVEAALRQNPPLRAVVEEIRATASQLEAALAEEPIVPPASVPSAPSAPFARKPAPEVQGHFAEPVTAKPPRRSRRRMTIIHDHDSEPAKTGGAPDPYARKKGILSFPQFYFVIGGLAAACFAMLMAFRTQPGAGGRTVDPSGQLDSARNIAVAPVVPPAGAAAADSGNTPIESKRTSSAATSVADAGMVSSEGTPAGSSRFFDRGLTLIEQTRADRAHADEMLAAAAGENVARSTTAESSSSEAEKTAAGDAGSTGQNAVASAAAESGNHPVSDKITFNPMPPLAPGPLVASSSNIWASAAGSTSLLPSTPGHSGSTGSGEIVMLSAMFVSANRAVGFDASSSAAKPETRKVAISDRENLPHPPPGARFARRADRAVAARENEFVSTAREAISTLGIDVDTASYGVIRQHLEHSALPPRDAVRIEEMLNYFPYRYAAPRNDPIAVSLEVAEAPWAPSHRLVRVGLKAREVATTQRPAANLVFLIDVSSSMNQPNKLPLVKQSMRLLVGKLRPDDRVAIVTYAGNSGLALASTPAARSREILNALDTLTPLPSASATGGIELAYDVARENFVSGGINRVILCTDGDDDVGISRRSELLQMVEDRAESGIFLSVLGFSVGNYRDGTLERLASLGNGIYGYIDTFYEAERLFVQQVNSTLVTVAKDVKVQVDFNPAQVASYRLIGYENRLLRKEDFSDDNVESGEMGAGQAVTALYEIVPARNDDRTALLAAKYASGDARRNDLLTVSVRYRKPDGFLNWLRPQSLEFPLVDSGASFAQASADFRFAAAVAQFGMTLRDSPYRGDATLGDVVAWAAGAATKPSDDPGGFRGEFIDVVRKAQSLAR